MIRYAIIEDEVPARRLIESLVAELRPGWECAALLDSVEGAVKWFRGNPRVDVVFMDIQLSDGLSFDILEQVDIEGMIIFTTAYDEYAVRAFKVNSIDYLLKPIKKQELAGALEKFEQHSKPMLRSRNQAIDVAELMDALKGAKQKYRKRFLVSRGEVFLPVLVEDVAYIFSRNRITSLMTFEGKRYVVDFPLDRLEEQLDPGVFFRANRGFMVNEGAVVKVHTFFNGKLVLEVEPGFDEKVIVSREKASRFKEWLDR